MNEKEIRVAELFAGIGGFRLGLERANLSYPRIENGKTLLLNTDGQPVSGIVNEDGNGRQQCARNFKIVWANEWDKYACQIYRKNFGEKELTEGDIRKIDTADIPDFDIGVGGFPCQPHSLAGKRKGFSEERGEVFHQIIRIARAKKPKMLLLENVKGLLSSEQGKAFGTVLEELGNIGYWVEWKTLNSKYFGVPQNRERVFIIGHLRGASTRQVFPIGCNGGEDTEVGEVAGTLTGGGHSGGLHSNMTAILADNLGGNIKQRERDATKNPAWTLGGSTTLLSVRSGGRGSLDRHSWDVIETAQALQTDGMLSFGTNKPQSNRNIRRLTPTECERLQGFPDGWTNNVSDTQRYKTLGNAVTVPVIRAIGELILGQF
ncbi:MAG: DNA (cytosine-5-)-methyltransferase, partial [Candidatus Bathyarchaeia archaeon]